MSIKAKVKAWIQNSDEDKDDFVVKNGKIVPVENKDERQEYVNKMFSVKDEGKIIFKKPSLEIIRSIKESGLFLVNMNADNKDKHGRRIAVMLMLEEYQEEFDNDFSALIEKTFSTTHTKVSKEALEEIRREIKRACNEVNLFDDVTNWALKNKGMLLLIFAVLTIIYLILKIIESC